MGKHLKFSTIVYRIHHSIPPGMRNAYRFLIVLFRKFRDLILPVRYFTFKEFRSGENLSLMFIGWDNKLSNYWLNRFTDKYESGGASRRITVWEIPRFIEKNRYRFDMAIIQTGKAAHPERFPGGFLLPRWMEMELDIATSMKKSRIKQTIRDINKYSLSWEIREGMDAFDLFYYRMYLPLTKMRHGDKAEISDYKHFSNKFRTEDCKLFFIMKEHEPLAAAFVEENWTVRLSALGVRDGEEKLIKMGVIGALYYFVMLYYYKLGKGSILVGNSMPVVSDGVTAFKLLIGAKPCRTDLPGKEKFFLVPFNEKPGTLSILKSNPFFHLCGEQLCMALYMDDMDFKNKMEFTNYIHRLKIKHVDRTEIYFPESVERISHWLHEEQLEDIVYIKI